MQTRTRSLLTVAGVAGAAAVAVAAARARRPPAWATVDDPLGPEGIALPPGERTTIVTDDEARLEVLVAGPADGPTVVLSHCWTGGMGIWGAVARRLVASGHRVVLYDQRGHGRSTLGRDPLTVDRLGEDLRTVLETLDVRDAVLAGHSMGGMTVQALATNHPDIVAARARGIVLAGTAAHVTRVPVPAPVATAVLGDRRTAKLAAQDPWSMRRMFGDAVHRSHVDAARDALLATTGTARAACLVAMSRMDYRRGLSKIGVPTVVLVGAKDRLTAPARARVLAAAIPNARLEVLEGIGHMLPLEVPDVLTAEIAKLAAPSDARVSVA
jgi:pimeloyl-ACP methyl ester carboxylesterase